MAICNELMTSDIQTMVSCDKEMTIDAQKTLVPLENPIVIAALRVKELFENDGHLIKGPTLNNLI